MSSSVAPAASTPSASSSTYGEITRSYPSSSVTSPASIPAQSGLASVANLAHALPPTPVDLETTYDPNDPTVSASGVYLSSYALPNARDTANRAPLPLGLLLAPTVHLHAPPPRVHAPLPQCSTCAASINPHCRLTAASAAAATVHLLMPEQRWTCALCGTSQPFQSHLNQYVQPAAVAGPVSPASQPSIPVELAYHVLETVTPASAHAAILPPTVFPASASTRSTANFSSDLHPHSTGVGLNYAFLIDRHINKTEFGHMKRLLHALVKDLPPDAGLALLVFSSTVAWYDLMQSGMAAAHVHSGETGPTVEAMENHVHHHGIAFPRVSRVRDTFFDVLDSLEQTCTTADAQKQPIRRAMGAAVDWVTSLVQAGREYDALRAPSSPSATAATTASPSASSFAFTHMIVLASGAPDFGPGETAFHATNTSKTASKNAAKKNATAVDFFAALGQRAHAHRMQIDIVAQSVNNEFAVPIVRKLVDPTGGEVFLIKTWSEQTMQDLRACLFRSVGYDGAVDVFLSSGLTLRRVIGGVAQLDLIEGKTEAVGHLRLSLANCRPDQSIALYYDLQDDLPQDYVYIQLRTTWRDWNHQLVSRTSTHRLRTTGNTQTYIRSIDAKVIAVLLAKSAVTQVMHGDTPVQVQSGMSVRLAAVRHSNVIVRDETRDAVSTYSLPAELSPLPLFLYHLRRGPLIDSAQQHHPDEVDVARSLFLRSPRSDAWRAIQPSLLSFDARGALEELPLESLALQSTRILLLDAQREILVWSGAQVAAPAWDAYRRACLDRAAAQARFRVPHPEVVACEEGASVSRRLESRLVPSHHDTPERQNRSFPEMRAWTTHQRAQFCNKLPPTDEPSFAQYFEQLFARSMKDELRARASKLLPF